VPAIFSFIAFLLFGTRVAQTIGGDIVNLRLIHPEAQRSETTAGNRNGPGVRPDLRHDAKLLLFIIP
jgi:hypothetical protein